MFIGSLKVFPTRCPPSLACSRRTSSLPLSLHDQLFPSVFTLRMPLRKILPSHMTKSACTCLSILLTTQIALMCVNLGIYHHSAPSRNRRCLKRSILFLIFQPHYHIPKSSTETRAQEMFSQVLFEWINDIFLNNALNFVPFKHSSIYAICQGTFVVVIIEIKAKTKLQKVANFSSDRNLLGSPGCPPPFYSAI